MTLDYTWAIVGKCPGCPLNCPLPYQSDWSNCDTCIDAAGKLPWLQNSSHALLLWLCHCRLEDNGFLHNDHILRTFPFGWNRTTLTCLCHRSYTCAPMSVCYVYFSQCARPLHRRSDQHIICCACPRERDLPAVWHISEHCHRRCSNGSILQRHHSTRKTRDHPATRQRTRIHVDLRTWSLWYCLHPWLLG